MDLEQEGNVFHQHILSFANEEGLKSGICPMRFCTLARLKDKATNSGSS